MDLHLATEKLPQSEAMRALKQSLENKTIEDFDRAVAALEASDRAVYEKIADYLEKYPGFLSAAKARNKELLEHDADQSSREWERILNSEDGLSITLELHRNQKLYQAMLCSSPFVLIKLPSEDNNFYQ